MSADSVLARPFGARLFALLIGLSCHTLFACAVWSMFWGIYAGLQSGRGTLSGIFAVLCNLLLVLQFPIFHSLLLSTKGRAFLRLFSPREIAGDMVTTWFALFASLQIFALFHFWSPAGIVWFRWSGMLELPSRLSYAAAWIFLSLTMVDADITLQSGAKGWLAVVRNRRTEYHDFPQHRTFRLCRQPIYLAFALVLWTAPVWTPDHAVLTLVWSCYCIAGPRLKEDRFVKIFGDRFRRYQLTTPYFVPFTLPRARGAVSRVSHERPQHLF